MAPQGVSRHKDRVTSPLLLVVSAHVAPMRTSPEYRRARRRPPARLAGTAGPRTTRRVLSVDRRTVLSVSQEPLPDRWRSRDLPILLETARQADRGDEPDLTAMAAVAGCEPRDVERSLAALADAGYLHAVRGPDTLAGPGTIWELEILERGRRATGLWPNGDDAVAQLLDALRQAEDLVDDPEEKTALRKAGGQLATVSRNVIAEVIAAVVTRQAGL